MSEKIKYTRRELKGPDEFLTAFGRAVAWAKGNTRAVGAGILGVVALFALVLGTRAYLQWEEDKASLELWPHLNRAQEFLQAPNEADPEKLASLEQFLAAHVKMHPKTRAGVYARYYLGSIAFQRRNYDLSVTEFRAGIATGKSLGIMEHLLREGVARALEAKEDYPGAFEAYRDAARFAQGDMRTYSLQGEARNLALAGKKADAVALYRKILQENPETRSRDMIEIQLAQME